MNCNDVRENLIELLTDGPADPQLISSREAMQRLRGRACLHAQDHGVDG